MACGTSSRVQPQGLLAHELRHEQLQRLVALLALGEVHRARRHGRRQPGEDFGEPVPAQRRDGQHLAAAGEPARLVEARVQPRPVHEVDLVEHDHGGQAGAGDRLGDVAVAGAERLGRVEQHERGVDLAQRVVDGRLHAARERVERLLEARQVEQHDLAAVEADDAGDAPPGGLRVVADDADLAPDQRVDQRGLAHVGTPEDGDEAAAEVARQPALIGRRSASRLVRHRRSSRRA